MNASIENQMLQFVQRPVVIVVFFDFFSISLFLFHVLYGLVNVYFT